MSNFQPPVPNSWSLELFITAYEETIEPKTGFNPQLVVAVYFDNAGQDAEISPVQNEFLNSLAQLMESQKHLSEGGLSEHPNGNGHVISKAFSDPASVQAYVNEIKKVPDYGIFFDEQTNAWYADMVFS